MIDHRKKVFDLILATPNSRGMYTHLVSIIPTKKHCFEMFDGVIWNLTSRDAQIRTNTLPAAHSNLILSFWLCRIIVVQKNFAATCRRNRNRFAEAPRLVWQGKPNFPWKARLVWDRINPLSPQQSCTHLLFYWIYQQYSATLPTHLLNLLPILGWRLRFKTRLRQV